MAHSLCSTSSRAAVAGRSGSSRQHPRVCVAGSRQPSVVVRAAAEQPAAGAVTVKPPTGVTLPPVVPQVPPPTVGFVHFAEKINGRACMLGFFALLAVEAISGKGLLELMGLTVGNGLGFEL